MSAATFTFTVVTATYNRAHTLPRVYGALRGQTFTDFEWVVVDDGSTDGTADLLDGWLADAALRIVRLDQPNAGKHVALNRGVAAARGRLVMLHDSDDWCLPHTLARFAELWAALSEAEQERFAGVAGRVQDPEGQLVGGPMPAEILDSDEIDLRNRWLVRGDFVGVNRIEVLRQFPFVEIPGQRFSEEAIVFNRIAQRYRTRYVDEVLQTVEYQRGGLTDRGRVVRARNPASELVYYGELIELASRVAPSARLRHAANYCRYALHAGRPVWRTRAPGGGLGWWVAGLPVGVGLALADCRAMRDDRHR